MHWQNENTTLRRWLRGEEIRYSRGLTSQDFYRQAGALLRGLGVAEAEVGRLIRAAVFEERGWAQEAQSSREILRLRAREVVADRFGGVLPTYPGVEGVREQNKNATLSRWLRGEEIGYSAGCTPPPCFRKDVALEK